MKKILVTGATGQLGSELSVLAPAFPQYKYPNAKWRYARIADYLNLGGTTDDEKIDLLVAAIDDLKQKVGIPKSIKAAGVSEKKFYASLDAMSEQACVDQCTGANPRYPLIRELIQLYINAYEGKPEEQVKETKGKVEAAEA